MTELYIHNQVADTPTDVKAAVTKWIADIGDLSPKAPFTNKFKLPQTANNKRIFEQASLNSTTILPYRQNPCRLVVDGMELLPDGVCFVDAVGEDYEVQVVSGAKPFFEVIKDKSIRELDLSAFNHVWNRGNVISSRFHDYTDGWVYPFVEWGGSIVGNTVRADRMIPFFFVRVIWDKIFEGAGFDYECAIADTEEFKNLLLSYTNIAEATLTSAGNGDTPIVDGLPINQITPNTTTNKRILPIIKYVDDTNSVDFGFMNLDASDFLGGTNTGSGDVWNYRVPRSATYNITVAVRGLISSSAGSLSQPGSARIDLFYLPAGASSTTKLVRLDSTSVTTLTVGRDNLFLMATSGSYSLSRNDKVVAMISAQTNPFVPVWGDCSFVVTFDVDKMVYNSTQEWANSIHFPDIKQSDFIKSIMQMYGLILQYDHYNNKLVFRQFKTISTFDAVDWSDKLHDRSQVLTFRIEGWERKNHFLYKEDDLTRAERRGFANGAIFIDDEVLKPETDKVELVFAATPSIDELGYAATPFIPILDDDFELTGDFEPRIIILDKQVTSLQVTFADDDGSVQLAAGNEFPFAKFLGLYWSELIDAHYRELISMLTRAKVLTAYFNLTAQDIETLDHFKPVYIKKYSEYFYLEKVENYIPGQLTKCRLIRL